MNLWEQIIPFIAEDYIFRCNLRGVLLMLLFSMLISIFDENSNSMNPNNLHSYQRLKSCWNIFITEFIYVKQHSQIWCFWSFLVIHCKKIKPYWGVFSAINLTAKLISPPPLKEILETEFYLAACNYIKLIKNVDLDSGVFTHTPQP
jgi:hypothetical protein